MQKDEIKKLFDEEVASIRDMAESAGSIKGEQFVDLALASYECQQIIEIGSMMAEIGELELEEADPPMQMLMIILRSLTTKLARGMSSADIEEAMKLGSTMMDRKMQLRERIKSMMG